MCFAMAHPAPGFRIPFMRLSWLSGLMINKRSSRQIHALTLPIGNINAAGASSRSIHGQSALVSRPRKADKMARRKIVEMPSLIAHRLMTSHLNSTPCIKQLDPGALKLIPCPNK